MTKTHQKFEWSTSYEIGIPEIDAQHKKLIAISNELYDVATKENGESFKKEMSKVLKSLTDYTIYHFSNEEAFQTKYEYSGVAMHKVAHDQFIAELKNQIMKLENGGTQEDALVFYEYVANWIITHIGRADPVWAKFVKTKL